MFFWWSWVFIIFVFLVIGLVLKRSEGPITKEFGGLFVDLAMMVVFLNAIITAVAMANS